MTRSRANGASHTGSSLEFILLLLIIVGGGIAWYVTAGRIFDEAPDPSTIAGSTWDVIEVNDEPSPPEMSLSFDESTVTIRTVCRDVTGRWDYDSDGLAMSLGSFDSSNPPCTGAAATEESTLLDALLRVDSWSVANGQILL